MTRGRKKDLTIPPTRALVQQRDYRARKAHYIADLEERVRRVEAENFQLRKDLEVARAGIFVPATPLSRQIVGDVFLSQRMNVKSRLTDRSIPQLDTSSISCNRQPEPLTLSDVLG